jgi:signal transduction histidine kinase/ActR/RegA family two-component response regulator
MATFWRQRSGAGAYALAAGLALGAMALHLAIGPWVGPRIQYLFFLPAIAVAAALGGRGPALLVLLVGVASALFVVPNLAEPQAGLPSRHVALAAYLLAGLVLALFGSRVRLMSRRVADAEQRLRVAQDDTGIGLFEVDFAAKTVHASPVMAKLLDQPAAQGMMTLAQWRNVLPADEVDKGSRYLKQKLAEGAEGYEREHRIALAGGRERWLMSRVHIERGPDGRALRIRGASVDITARKETDLLLRRTQDELRQQVADLQLLHDVSSRLPEIPALPAQLALILGAVCDVHGADKGLVWLLSRDVRHLRVEASQGYDAETLQRLSDVRPGQGASGLAYLERRRVVIDDAETDPRFEAFRWLARENGFRAVHSTPMIGLSGEIIGAVSVHLRDARRPTEREVSLADIYARKAAVFTERACAAALAEEAEHRFQVALESSTVPFALMQPIREASGVIVDFRWEYLNDAAARTLRQPVSALVGRPVTDVVPHGWDVPDLFDTYVTVAVDRQPRELTVHMAPGGAERWFHVIASPSQDAVAVWFADITERKRHEQSLQEADRRKDEFLATLAHELRNPLAPIRQAALISKAAAATEAQKRWSHDVIDRQVQHMALLLDDLLDVSRITRGMLQLRKAPTELAPVIDAAVETARPLIDGKRHQLLVDVPAEPVRLEVDALRLAQVIGNLLTNAAKYTDPHGTIRLVARAGGDEIVIEVSDNGIGLRADALDEIFLMFTQVRSGEDRSSGGLGIGLALAKGLVELHGGSIAAASDGPGLGSRFTVRLPAMAVQPHDSVPASARERPRTPHRRVLVADDNRDAADSLAALLRMSGHEVTVVYDGDAALAQFRLVQPDVALLDIGMPKRSGYEVASAIRQEETNGAATMLVAITGWGQDRDRSTAIAAGFDHHLTKPVDPEEVQELIGRHAARALGEVG